MTIQQSEDMPAVSAGAGAAALLSGGAMTATARAAAAREMAEVMAQVQVAQAVPRNMRLARERVKDSCDQYRFAKAAFFSYRRGGNVITGPTIKLIRELAAAFGNFQWGLVELDRDPVRGYSMMMAWAWDVQTNARDSTTFMVRAVRDLAPEEEGGERRKVPLIDERDIYENNANMGARRVRAMMQTLLPAWFVEEAEDLCRTAIARGPKNGAGGYDPLPVRLANAVDAFARDYAVRPEQLEGVIGAEYAKWGPNDLVRLITLYESLQRGDIKRDEAFPPPKATAGDVAAQAGAAPGGAGATAGEAGPAPEPEQPGPGSPEPGAPVTAAPVTAATVNALETAFATCGWAGDRNASRRVAVAAGLAGLPVDAEPGEWADLDEAQGRAALAALETLIAGTPAGERRDALHDVYSKRRGAVRDARRAAQQAAQGQATASGQEDAPPPAGQAGDAAPAGQAGDAAPVGQAAEIPSGTVTSPAEDGTGEHGPDTPPPADPAGPVTDPTLRALLTKITGVTGLRGTGAAVKARRLVIIGVLVTGHWHDFGDDPAQLTEAQARRAISRFDELEESVARRGGQLSEVMQRLHDDAIAQRGQQAQP